MDGRTAHFQALLIISIISTFGRSVGGNVLDVTFVNTSPLTASDGSSYLYAVLGGADSTGALSFQRFFDSSGQNPGSSDTWCPMGASDPTECGLPSGTMIESYDGSPTTPPSLASILRVLLPGSLNRPGVYRCRGDRYNWTTEASTSVMYTGAEYKPTLFTATLSLDEDITLTMQSDSSTTPTWMLNGVTDLTSSISSSTGSGPYEHTLYINRASKGVEGVHHAYDSDRELGGLIRLIVRDCLDGLWGALCEYTCPTCYNGGVCDDQSGRCVCPPGFSGDHCETSCPSGFFGKGCTVSCMALDGAMNCGGALFCLPDPYGCSCGAGWRGITCEQACDDGTYGAGCLQTCHCSNDASCNKSTGKCSAGCADGWTGDQCQVKVIPATAVNRQARVSPSNFIGIFITDDYNDPSVQFFIGRGLDTGPGETGHGVILNTNDPNDIIDTGLPPGTTVSINPNSDQDQDSLRANFDATSGGMERVGAYRVRVGYKGNTEQIMMLNENMDGGNVWPDKLATTAGIGETASLSMSTAPNVNITSLRWRRNGADVTEWSGNSTVTLEELRVSDAGIYECYEEGQRESGQHAIMKLIVRGCPSSKWGIDCSRDCPDCYAGGVCHDVTGECVCRPGFKGVNCDDACSNNNWGKDCNVLCSKADGNCINRLLSPPDPVGMSCINGFTGYGCGVACTGSKFGANCELDCNCANSSSCTSDGGSCPGACANGFSGPLCQVSNNSCPTGYFGNLCKYPCHCQGGGSCDRATGECADGVECQEGWGGADCQQALPRLSDMPWVEDVSNDTVVLVWNAWKDGFDFGTGPIDSYSVTYSWSDDVGNQGNASEPFIVEYDSAAQVGNLFGFRDYEFYVSARRMVEGQILSGSRMGPITAQTLCGSPLLSPTNVSAVVTGVDTVAIYWQLPEEPASSWLQCDSSSFDFRITYSAADKPDSGVKTAVAGGNETSRIIDKLDPCTRYTFFLAIINSNEFEGPAYQTEATTDTAPPEPVDDIVYNSTSYNDLEVTWSEPNSECLPVMYNVTRTLLLRDQCDNSFAGFTESIQTDKASVFFDDIYAYSTYELTVLSLVGNVEASNVSIIVVNTTEHVPAEAPSDLVSDNSVKAQITFRWSIPPCGSRNGDINYAYNLTEAGGGSLVYSEVRRETSKVFPNLPHWTWFDFEVCAMTSVGAGPCDSNRTRTLPSQPSVPRDVGSVPDSINQTHATVSWKEPEFLNGELLLYQLTKNQEVIEIKDNLEEEMFYTFMDLEPGSTYIIRVRATSNGGQGDDADFELQTLPIPLPGTPSQPETVSKSRTYIYINWTAPAENADDLGVYAITGYDVRVTSVLTGDPVIVDASVDPAPVMTYNVTDLTSGTAYDIEVRATNEGGPGTWSESLREQTSEDPPTTPPTTPPPTGPDPLVVALSVSIPVVLLILLAGGILFYNKRRQPPVAIGKEDGFLDDNTTDDAGVYVEMALTSPKPIPVDDLGRYIKMKRISPGGFDQEYESLYNGEDKESAAYLPENKAKNRYKNIITSEKHRVRLTASESGSDYINATFMNGYMKTNAYIATQGPNMASVNDFWQMVYEQKSAVIVMLTNLIEDKKNKCIEYWPKPKSSKPYGNISVTGVEEEVYGSYAHRRFSILGSDGHHAQNVSQYHYTIWPDKSVPGSSQPLIDFRNIVRTANPAGAGPVIVHCSAGAGRTGTFIALDSMMEMTKAEKKVDIFDFVNEMRTRRTFMVQVQQQYEFIYETLLEWSVCPSMAITASDFGKKLKEWRRLDPTTGQSQISMQFELLDSLVPMEIITSKQKGYLPENKKKNRFTQKVPLDRCRPLLMTEGDGPGENSYINASFFNFDGRKNAHLCTQCPLPSTVGDFWRLVFDYDCNTVVQLNAMDDTCGQYWPDHDRASFGSFTIELLACERPSDSIIKRVMKVTSSKKKEDRRVSQYQYHGWSDGAASVPKSGMDFYSLLEEVERGRTSSDEKIAVICIDGIGASPTFLAAMATVQKVREDSTVDVFSNVKRLRRSRPGAVDDLKRYDFVFDVVLAQQDSVHAYANL